MYKRQGFIGHSVADRKIIEQRKAFDKRLGATDEALYDVDMDFAEFQEWSDIWAQDMYGRDQHSALKKRTPFEVAAAYAGPIRKIEHEAALDVLLAPIASNGGMRTVTKQGVRVDGAYYLPMCQRRSKIRPLWRSKSRPVWGERLGACGPHIASPVQGALAVRPIL